LASYCFLLFQADSQQCLTAAFRDVLHLTKQIACDLMSSENLLYIN